MARPRSDGPRYPCGQLRPKKPAFVIEAENQRRWQAFDTELDADLIALRLVLSPQQYGRWIEAGCDFNALPIEVRRYLNQDRALRQDAKRWQRGQVKLLEMRERLIGQAAA